MVYNTATSNITGEKGQLKSRGTKSKMLSARMSIVFYDSSPAWQELKANIVTGVEKTFQIQKAGTENSSKQSDM